MRKTALLIFCLSTIFFARRAAAQNKGIELGPGSADGPDTSYYKSFRGSLIPRVFFSRNYSQLHLKPGGGLPDMHYHANTPLNFGVGIAYKYFSFSISKGLGFLQSDSRKGHTNSFDLQTHVYRRKWTFDALAQFYQGYYLSQPNIGPEEGKPYYIRPDMRVRRVGITGYRILNDRRFSYGSGLGQGGLQQRSAGSFLLGGNAFYTAINADSALAPHKIDSNYNNKDIRKLHLVILGVGAGYAYTFVYQKHWFLLGSANVNLNANFSREIGDGIHKGKAELTHNFIFRAGAGYNTPKMGVSFLWFTGGINAEGGYSHYNYSLQTGSYRLIFVRRFATNKRTRQMLEE
jgi:hypothetical protein